MSYFRFSLVGVRNQNSIKMVLFTFCKSQIFDLGKFQPLKFFYVPRKKNGCSGILSSKILTEGNDEQGSKYWFSLRYNVVLLYSGALVGKNEKQIVAGPLMVLCQILASKIWDVEVLYGFIYWVHLAEQGNVSIGPSKTLFGWSFKFNSAFWKFCHKKLPVLGVFLV